MDTTSPLPPPFPPYLPASEASSSESRVTLHLAPDPRKLTASPSSPGSKAQGGQLQRPAPKVANPDKSRTKSRGKDDKQALLQPRTDREDFKNSRPTQFQSGRLLRSERSLAAQRIKRDRLLRPAPGELTEKQVATRKAAVLEQLRQKVRDCEELVRNYPKMFGVEAKLREAKEQLRIAEAPRLLVSSTLGRPHEVVGVLPHLDPDDQLYVYVQPAPGRWGISGPADFADLRDAALDACVHTLLGDQACLPLEYDPTPIIAMPAEKLTVHREDCCTIL